MMNFVIGKVLYLDTLQCSALCSRSAGLKTRDQRGGLGQGNMIYINISSVLAIGLLANRPTLLLVPFASLLLTTL